VAFLLWRAGPGVFDLLASGSSVTGLAERVEIWQRGLYLLQDFPFTGAGLGMFSQVVPALYPYILVSPEVVIPDAHNLPLQVGADLGIPGLVAWLAIVIGQIAMLTSVLRHRADALTWALAAGSLGATAAVLAAGSFSAMNWGVKPAFLPWMVTALVVILHGRLFAEPGE
jgi:putative inorganic carbon (HCO3(-)) transporter